MENKLEKARLLMDKEVSEATSDEALRFNFDLIESEVLAYCNRWDFPTGLMLIVIQMVAEYTKANFYKAKVIADANNPEIRKISSVTRGDTTISYGDNSKVTEYGSPYNLSLDPAGFINDYKARIREYRKVGLA
ncbi:MAG: hypothetical protein SOU08_00170 [Anaerococcus sp.]|nr:hypothetical protein [Anaerococcus sp.]